MAAHLAMSAALDGYRVLVVDLDSQGSMTSIFGGKVASRMGHGLPARSPATTPSGCRPRTAAASSAATPPLPLDETLDAALEKSASDVIQKTHWPNIDLIGAQLNLYWAEFQIPVWRMSLRAWKLWEALGQRLRARRRPRRATTSSSSTPPLPSAT